MDNIVLWVALVSVISTLAGVYLGNWLQSRNIRRQREWMLQDQKREWVRAQRREEFEQVLKYLEGTIEFALTGAWVLQFSSQERQDDLFLSYREKVASVMPIVHTTMVGEDKELVELLSKFVQIAQEITNALLAKDQRKLDVIANRLSEIAAPIRQHFKQLLEETFD